MLVSASVEVAGPTYDDFARRAVYVTHYCREVRCGRPIEDVLNLNPPILASRAPYPILAGQGGAGSGERFFVVTRATSALDGRAARHRRVCC